MSRKTKKLFYMAFDLTLSRIRTGKVDLAEQSDIQQLTIDLICIMQRKNRTKEEATMSRTYCTERRQDKDEATL